MGKVQIIRDAKGKPVFAVLFWKDYIELVDARPIEKAKKITPRTRKKAKR